MLQRDVGDAMTDGEHGEALGRMMLSDERPCSTYHDASNCWDLIEFMLSRLKECHRRLDTINSLANQIKHEVAR